MTGTERIFSDIDEYVTLRLAGDGAVAIAISPAGFRQPPGELARLVLETAERLPHPRATGDEAVRTGLEAIGQMHQAMETGGYEAFTEMMHQRLGIEPPAGTLQRTPDLDRALASHLDGILTDMRRVGAAGREPPDQATAEARTDEGDLAVTTGSERIIAALSIKPAARHRGVDGLGAALTDLLATARRELRERAADQIRRDLPEDAVETMDGASHDGARAGEHGTRVIEQAVRGVESLKRKAGRE